VVHVVGFMRHKKICCYFVIHKSKGGRILMLNDNQRPASWKTAFPGLQENEAGTYLAGARHREGLTQRQLAEKSGIPQRHISEMENGKRTIGKENAKKLAAALNADYRAFL
jgi:DNA-binding XRE family transcriptional regulator